MQVVFCLLVISVLAQNNLANFECPANGYAIALGCSTSQQCSPYTTDPVDCIGNACCIKSNNSDQVSPYRAPLICSNNGSALVVGCNKSEQCLPFTNEPVACLQGICCTVGFCNNFFLIEFQ